MQAGAIAEHLFPSWGRGRGEQGGCVTAHKAAAISKPMFPSQASNVRNVMNMKIISEVPEFLRDP